MSHEHVPVCQDHVRRVLPHYREEPAARAVNRRDHTVAGAGDGGWYRRLLKVECLCGVGCCLGSSRVGRKW